MDYIKFNLILLVIGLILVIITLGYYFRHPELNNINADENQSVGSGIYEY